MADLGGSDSKTCADGGAPGAATQTGFVLAPGDLVFSPDSASFPGLAALAGGGLETPGTISADDVEIGGAASGPVALSSGAKSLRALLRAAAFGRVRDGEISDRHFVRSGAIPPSALAGVLPVALGGTGTDGSQQGSGQVSGSGLVVFPSELGGLAGAPTVSLVGSLSPLATLAAASAVRLYPSLGAMASGGPHHTLSVAADGSSLVATHSAPGSLPFPLGTGAPGTGQGAPAPARPAPPAIALERLSYSRARYAVTVQPPASAPPDPGASQSDPGAQTPTAPVARIRAASYAAAGADPGPAERPRDAGEVLTGLSPAPPLWPAGSTAPAAAAPAAPPLPDHGFSRSAVLQVPPGGGAAYFEETDVPGADHRALRAVAEDALGNLSDVSELVWDSAPPRAASVSQPRSSGLSVFFAASNEPRPAFGASLSSWSSPGADSGPLLVRAGLLLASGVSAGGGVPGFCNAVGPLAAGDLPFAGGLTRANADSPAGGAVAWALWESLSRSERALELAAPLVAVPAGASSNLSFRAATHLAYDAYGTIGNSGGTSGGAPEGPVAGEPWTAEPNRYGDSYKPFVLLGDAFSNLSLHLFEEEVVSLTNPRSSLAFAEFGADGTTATVRYSLSADAVEATARVFRLDPALAAYPDAEPAGLRDGGPFARLVVGQGPGTENAPSGSNEATFSNLAHTAFHRLVVDIVDVDGAAHKDHYDFRTADASQPSLAIAQASVDAEGAVRLAWSARDSNDGGVSRVSAFSGAAFPAETEAAVSARVASSEPRRLFPGINPSARGAGAPPSSGTAVGNAVFAEGATDHHLSHYVQLVAEDAAGLFHYAGETGGAAGSATGSANRVAFADFGAEVPAVVESVSAPEHRGQHVNAVVARRVAFEADTSDSSAYLVGLSARAAELLFGPGDPLGAGAAAASNLWSLVETRGGLPGFSNAIGAKALRGTPLPAA